MEQKIPFGEGYMKVLVVAEDCVKARIKLILVRLIYVTQCSTDSETFHKNIFNVKNASDAGVLALLMALGLRMWSGFIWHRVRTDGVLCIKPSDSVKRGVFLD
jgi:hypothetical protein